MKMKKLLILTLVLMSIFLVACSKGSLKFEEDKGLNSVRDEKELKKLLAPKEKSIWQSIFGGSQKVSNDDVADAAPEDDSSEDGASKDYTKTNVQVEGVDEADIVKTDGNRIYSIKYDYLQVVNVLGDGKMSLALSEKLGSSESYSNNSMPQYDYYNGRTYFTGLYVTDKYLVAVGQKYEYHYMIDETQSYKSYNYVNMSIIYLYDINTLEKVKTFEVSGYLNDSRLIEDRLYLISNFQTYNNAERDLRPYFVEDDKQSYVSYNDIKYLDNMSYQAFTIITLIKLDDEPKMENDTFLAQSSWGQTYVSHNGIYFATYVYDSNWLGKDESYGMVISYMFDKETGRVTYGGTAKFKGNLLNQFSMDEYNGYLRIATSEGWFETLVNRIYVFKRELADGTYELKQVGLLDKGLGKPNERIKSVRFNKDIATVVTYVETDPFYTIDLSDPTKPTIKGELIVTGYSAYQHPWSEGYVLGIGFEGVGNNIIGMKLSLYDIRDIDNPVEVGKPLLFTGADWTYSEALYNHKSIMIDSTRGYFGFSLWRNNWGSQYFTSKNEYIVFEVNPENETPITMKHRVDHMQFFNSQSDYYYYWNYDFEIKRGLRIDDYLYVISGEVITSHNLEGEFGLVDHIVFGEEINNQN